MQRICNRRSGGWTLIELLLVIAVVALLAGFATRMATSAIHAARASSSVSSLFAALTRARSFAATAAVDVVLCPSRDGRTCTSGFHWENGWIAFPATHPGSDRYGDEPIIWRQPALPAKVRLITSSGRTRIRFQPSGGNAGSNATFTLCDGRGPRKATAYAMANNGSLHDQPVDPARVSLACGG